MPNKQPDHETAETIWRANDNKINKLIEILFQKQILSEEEKNFLLSL